MALNKIERISSAAIGSILLVSAMLAACGDETTEVTQVVGMQVVEEGDALPKCNTENEGQMVYSVDSAAAYYCINRKWTSLKGQDGADGKDGKDGADGKDGEDGANGKDGKNGKDGNDGSDGKNCEIVSDTNGVTTLKCGDDTTTLYKAMCGLTPYDPAKQYCSLQGIFDLEKCDGKLYNPKTHFCDTRDSSLYRYVTIGSQVWMAENLNYADSVKTPSLLGSSWCFNNEPDSCAKFGRLYTWGAAIDSAKLYKENSIECGYGKTCTLPDTVHGICPPGWHLPDTTEWNTLFTAVGGREVAGKILKSQTGWKYGNGTDAFGFSALSAGFCRSNGGLDNDTGITLFWTSTPTDWNSHKAYFIFFNDYYAFQDPDYNGYAHLDADLMDPGFSVRCIQDRM